MGVRRCLAKKVRRDEERKGDCLNRDKNGGWGEIIRKEMTCSVIFKRKKYRRGEERKEEISGERGIRELLAS